MKRKSAAASEDCRAQTGNEKCIRNRPPIELKSDQIRSPGRPGSDVEPKGRLSAPKSAPRHAPRDSEGALGDPQGRPRSEQGPPKTALKGSERPQEGLQEEQNRAQGGRRREKNQFLQKCSATRPCRCARHFGLPQIALESVQDGPKEPQDASRTARRAL